MPRPTAKFEVDTGKCGEWLKAYWQFWYAPDGGGYPTAPVLYAPAHGPQAWAWKAIALNATDQVLDGLLGEALNFSGQGARPYLPTPDSPTTYRQFPSNDGGYNTFAWAAWVKHNTLIADQILIGHWHTDARKAFKLVYDHANTRYQFHARTSGGTEVVANGTTFGAPSTDQWNLVAGYYVGNGSSTGTEIGISVNGGAFDVQAISPTFVINQSMSGIVSCIGSNASGSDATLDAQLGGLFYWYGGVPGQQELKALYNSGRGSRLMVGVVT